MVFVVADRVQEATTTTGTGVVTLAGAVTGFRAFSSKMVNGDTCDYCIEGGVEWEVGTGTWQTGNLLARTAVLSSSNADALVNFSAGTKDVFLTAAAARLAASIPVAPPLALASWRQGLANRHYARANVVVIGDSLVEGHGVTTQNRRWITRLQRNLLGRFPVAGVGAGGMGHIGAMSTGETSYVWPVVITGSPIVGFNYGAKRQMVNFGTGISWLWSGVGTSVDFYYAQPTTASTMGWSVDGGAVTTFNTAGAAVKDGFKLHIPLGTSGPHTVNITWSSGGAIFANGLIVYDGDENAGIMFHDCGHFSWDTTQWLQPSLTSTQWPTAIANLGIPGKPDLVIISLGTNDSRSSRSITAATFQANIATLIAKIRSVVTNNPGFLLIGPSSYYDTSVTRDTTPYVQGLKNIANGDPLITVFDLNAVMPAGVNGGDALTIDGIHYTDLGASTVADLLASYLAG